MEENVGTVVDEVSDAAGIGLDELNRGSSGKSYGEKRWGSISDGGITLSQ
jgi:hypothetical protein